MSTTAASGWIDRARAAKAGTELLEFIKNRLTLPYNEGPFPDDRRGEGAEEVFERIAEGSEVFRANLEATIAEYFRSDTATPVDPATHCVTRGMLEMIQRLALPGTFLPIRAWLERYELGLRDGSGSQLGRAALAALATSQLPGIPANLIFWERCWQFGPTSWQPRAFIGLRLQNPQVAAGEIPELVRRAEGQPFGAGQLLFGMWKQREGRTALLEWLKATKDVSTADKVRRTLRPLLPIDQQVALGKPSPKRVLPTLARYRPLEEIACQ